MNDDFLRVVTRQRACRSFSPEPVDDDAIGLMLTAATFAPSAENKQPWEFVVVRDDATRAAIGDLSRRAWEENGRAFSERRLTPEMLADVDHGATGGVANAPVNIVGSALTTITTALRSEMQAILGLPEHVWPIALVPVGHPARPLGPPRRAPFTEHTHRERYGQAW